ncbi:uncharacterized protein LOC125002583 [Mugil cephalus]|uniref:uncharacterized protein LOC125002583 n=1 Tax=Mugil cephalus TaxID=48193 RepID=UPI001FB85C44|nr:uncharacterized protein LOC125002583 [Mugil cephalus]
MVGVRLRCLSCFLSALLLLGICLINVEASGCELVIDKMVGDTVVFSSCLPTVGVTLAEWYYRHGDLNRDVTTFDQFKGRYDEDSKNYTLTVRQLTRQDSGKFLFTSEVNNQQRPTVIITLRVHEPITQKPHLKQNNFTTNASNGSCTVSLECSSDRDVTYKWTVGSQTLTLTGPKLQYTIRPEDGDTIFNCTVSNYVSNQSAVITKTCSNDTMNTAEAEHNFFLILGVACGGCVLIVIIVGIAVVVCHQKKSNAEENDMTLYADIADVAPQTTYETVHSVTPPPLTVYDRIQLNRMRKASVSPYQEVS